MCSNVIRYTRLQCRSLVIQIPVYRFFYVKTMLTPRICFLSSQPMMDRNCSAELPKMQCGFIDFVCSFVYKVCIETFILASFLTKRDNRFLKNNQSF